MTSVNTHTSMQKQKLKLLLVIMQHNAGIASRGESYEYVQFYKTLQSAGYDVTLFDFMVEMANAGRDAMNEKLLKVASELRPDLAFFSLYTDQFKPEMIEKLRRITKTLCFFHDDVWRIEYSRSWAKHFDWFTTPDVHGPTKYKALGLQNVVFFPFGVNNTVYPRFEKPEMKYDVSFVGAWHPYREWLLKLLRKRGWNVKALGFRWPEGAASHEQMVALFNESRINLNLSNSANWDARYLFSSPRALLNRLRSPKTVEQLKGRHFEVCATGGFQLSYYIDGLERLFHLGEEIAVYLDPDDLIRKVEFYLENETLRQEIAERGYRRTLADHTYSGRFDEVFTKMGFHH